jgi:hypothetical protein
MQINFNIDSQTRIKRKATFPQSLIIAQNINLHIYES